MKSNKNKVQEHDLFCYPAINKVIEVFDVHGFYQVYICNPKIRYRSVKISENFAIFFHHCHIIIRKVLHSKLRCNREKISVID